MENAKDERGSSLAADLRFEAKAPEDVLAETRERKAELDVQRTKTAEALKRLG